MFLTKRFKYVAIVCLTMLSTSCSRSLNDGEVVSLPLSFKDLDAFIDSIEIINLEQPEGLLLGGMVELVQDDENWLLIDKSNCKIQRYSKDGRFMNTIGHRGNSSSEFLSIQNVQIIGDKCIVYSIPDKITEFTLDGTFLRSEVEVYLGDNSYQTIDGILSYMGYKPGDTHRLNLISDNGKIYEFLPTKDYVLNMMTGEPVFYDHGSYVSIIDSYNEIVYSYSDYEVSPFVTFDFGSYAIPEEFYKYSDVYKGAEFLLGSKFARLCRFMGNETTLFAEIALQEGSDAKFVYAAKTHGEWRWYEADKDYTMFSGQFRLFDDEHLIALIDAGSLDNVSDNIKRKIINTSILDDINNENNYVIAKVRIK